MARRKGWEQLSEGYRARLSRGGISRSEYEGGASLKSARGHRTPSGIGEKSYASLYKLARRYDYYTSTPGEQGRKLTPAEVREVLDTALARFDRETVEHQLRVRNANVRSYRAGDRRPGKVAHSGRIQSMPAELSWYH